MHTEGRTLIFAFEPPACREVAQSISGSFDFQLVLSRESYIRHFVQDIAGEYQRIIGIGLSKQLRTSFQVEQRFINRFRNQPIEHAAPEYIESYGSDHMQASWSVTWSYCNLVSYLLCRSLDAAEANASYYFVHINPRYSSVEIISKRLTRAFQLNPIQVG